MKNIKAPDLYLHLPRPYFFLAGSIEMGEAEDWQATIEVSLKDYRGTILNPRRDDWDSSWEQSLEDENFVTQVNWELNALDNADCVLVYFDPETKAPITLMELGLHAFDKKVAVCCPEGFYRKGNVDIICKKYGIPQVDTLEELIIFAKNNTTKKLGSALLDYKKE